jgi:hypothetical protein
MISPDLAGLRPIHCIGKISQLPETAAMAEEGRWLMLLLKQASGLSFGVSTNNQGGARLGARRTCAGGLGRSSIFRGCWCCV